jgi:hypothetical protein
MSEWIFKTFGTEFGSLPDGKLAEQNALLDCAVAALEHCRTFDTSGSNGEYEYGEIVNRRTPDIGQRFKTPKEAAKDALNKITAARSEK